MERKKVFVAVFCFNLNKIKIFSNKLLAALGPGIYSASNRNDYQKHKNNVSGEESSGRCVGLTTLPPSVSRLSTQCGILNILQGCRPPRPVTGIALLFNALTRRCDVILHLQWNWCLLLFSICTSIVPLLS
jgi:hypothetical protein